MTRCRTGGARRRKRENAARPCLTQQQGRQFPALPPTRARPPATLPSTSGQAASTCRNDVLTRPHTLPPSRRARPPHSSARPPHSGLFSAVSSARSRGGSSGPRWSAASASAAAAAACLGGGDGVGHHVDGFRCHPRQPIDGNIGVSSLLSAPNLACTLAAGSPSASSTQASRGLEAVPAAVGRGRWPGR